MLGTLDSPYLLRHGMRRGVRLLIREKRWRGPLLLLTIAVTLLFSALLFVRALLNMRTNLVAQTPVRLEVLAGARDQDIQEFYAAARATANIASIRYVTGDAFFVTLRRLEDAEALQQFVQLPRWRTVIAPSFLASLSSQQQQLMRLLRVTSAVHAFTVLFVIFCLALLALMVVHQTWQVRERQHSEIRLMHLLGATPLSAVLPAVTQTTILALGATALAGLITFGAAAFLRM